jgi:two-component system response regulator NreC
MCLKVVDTRRIPTAYAGKNLPSYSGGVQYSLYIHVPCDLTESKYCDSLPVKVLVVDDHEVVRKGVCAILTIHLQPEICEEAANGQEAITKALALQPDLILLDVNMPLMNGFVAARELKVLLPRVPILFLTMHDGENFLSEARRAGVQGFITKDRAGEVLIDAINAVLNNGTFFPPYAAVRG